MFLASKYCIILALLAALFSLASILTLQLFDHFFPEEGTLGFQAGDVTVLVLWIGSSMAGLAWLKQWVNNPSFNTGELRNEELTCVIFVLMGLEDGEQVVRWLLLRCLLLLLKKADLPNWEKCYLSLW